MYILQRKPVAWQERMLLIVEESTSLPKNWKLELPDFESHLDEVGYIEDGDEQLPFWETGDGAEPHEEE
jgi:hypothetical protein